MAITYPADETLLARGKYSTLGRERNEQIERIQKLSTTMMNCLTVALLGVQEAPTEKREFLTHLRTCLGNYENAWNRIDELNAERDALHGEAWDAEKVDA